MFIKNIDYKKLGVYKRCLSKILWPKIPVQPNFSFLFLLCAEVGTKAVLKGKLKGAQCPEPVNFRVPRFSSHPRAKVRCPGPPGSARAQPWEPSNKLINFSNLLPLSAWTVDLISGGSAHTGTFPIFVMVQ